MWISDISIRRPVLATMFIVSFMVLGIVSMSRLGIDLFPDVTFPFVNVTVVYPGASPEEVETLVTKPIEDAVSSVDGIRNIRSSSQYGISFIQLEFFIGTNSYVAAQQVRQKVDGVARLLPKDMDPPSVNRFDINALPVLYAGIKGDRSIKQLRFLIDTNIK